MAQQTTSSLEHSHWTEKKAQNERRTDWTTRNKQQAVSTIRRMYWTTRHKQQAVLHTIRTGQENRRLAENETRTDSIWKSGNLHTSEIQYMHVRGASFWGQCSSQKLINRGSPKSVHSSQFTVVIIITVIVSWKRRKDGLYLTWKSPHVDKFSRSPALGKLWGQRCLQKQAIGRFSTR